MGQGSGSGGIPGMGFMQMFTNMFNGGSGGSQPTQPPLNPPNPLFQSTPGYSQQIPLFGQMSDEDLAAFMANNGMRQPQGPPHRSAPASSTAAPGGSKYPKWGEGN